MPTINASPAAKKAPPIQEIKTGKPNPPKKPVLAGSTDLIPSIAGAEIILNIKIPIIIIKAIK